MVRKAWPVTTLDKVHIGVIIAVVLLAPFYVVPALRGETREWFGIAISALVIGSQVSLLISRHRARAKRNAPDE